MRKTFLFAAVLFPSSLVFAADTCQLRCVRVTNNGDTRVTISCHNLNLADCAEAAQKMSVGAKTCTGIIVSTCQDSSLRPFSPQTHLVIFTDAQK